MVDAERGGAFRTGENFDLGADLFGASEARLNERAKSLSALVSAGDAHGRVGYMRVIRSAADREVVVEDRRDGQLRRMLMFGSNNYLGLASHPHVRQRAHEAIERWGTGIGGPPFLNGYLAQTRDLEHRIAAEKGFEACAIFSSGFSANLGVSAGLFTSRDRVLYDEHSHASFYDGLRLARAKAWRFPHNDVQCLETMLGDMAARAGGDRFVAVEGVYSMDGDVAPLDRIVEICRAGDAMLIVDDAHGLGVLGETGKGICEHFGVSADVDIYVGTFSKALAVSGGFVCGSRDIVDYLRWMARPYMFSAAMPPQTVAAADAGLDVIAAEPERRHRLWDNVRTAAAALNSLAWKPEISPQSAILVVPAPAGMDIRWAQSVLHDAGIFVNPVEFPAVPREKQRFRVSLMATHTTDDIDRLAEAFDGLWRLWQSGVGPEAMGEPQRNALVS